MLRPVLLVLLALSSFAAVCALQRPLVPWPEGLGLRNKMEYAEEHLDEYDAVYLGSSRVVRGLDPRIVDARLAEAGIRMRSLNLAVGGCLTFEQDYLLHRILEPRPERLEIVFLEGGPVGLGLRDDNLFREPPNLWTDRGVGYHAPAETARILASLARVPLSPWSKLERAGRHLAVLGWNLTNYGKGEDWLTRRVLGRGPRPADLAILTESQGYQGLEEATGEEMSEEKRELLRDPAPYLERVAAIPAENAQEVDLDRLNLDVYREQYAAAARAGVRLIYFVPPGLEGSPERLRLHEAGIVPELLFFNDPERYPELFRLDHRFDKGHLDRSGVELFSEAFAEALIGLLARE